MFIAHLTWFYTNAMFQKSMLPCIPLLDLCPAVVSFTGVLDCVGVSEDSVSPTSHMCFCNPSAVATLSTTVCSLFIAYSSGVCGRLSEQPACCDERHLDLPIHFTFAPINYSTGQPIKNEGERSGPHPPKAATRQLSPWIIGAINLALSNKGVLTLLSPASLIYRRTLNTPVITDTYHTKHSGCSSVMAELSGSFQGSRSVPLTISYPHFTKTFVNPHL